MVWVWVWIWVWGRPSVALATTFPLANPLAFPPPIP